MVPCSGLEFVGLDLLDNGMLRRFIPQFTSHLASLGLEFSVKLIDASGEDPKRRRDLIYETMEAFGAKDLDFLPEASSHSPRIEKRFNHNAGGNFYAFFTADITAQYDPGSASKNTSGWDEDDEEGSERDDDNEEEDPTRPNSWYRGLNQNQRRSFEDSRTPFYRQINTLWYDSLREMGYVFWDKSRLVGTRHAQHLHNPRREGAGLVFVGEVASEREEARTCWRNEETVEDRLKGVKIPASQWRRLVEEFTTEPYHDYSYLERSSYWDIDTSTDSDISGDSILEDSE